MSNAASLIARLAAEGVSPDLLGEVAMALASAQAAAQAIEKRRASDVARTRLYRQRGGGDIPPELRGAVLQRDGHACVYCGSSIAPLHCDHVIPVSQGGDSSFDNLATACAVCNASKGGRTPEQWGGSWR